ncbi:amidase [Leptospira sp. WS92.C1]
MKTKNDSQISDPIEDPYLGISEISELIREKILSPVKIVKSCLKRIERYNARFNAFITILADQAIEDAKKAEQEINGGEWKGPLHGIPIGIKDMYDTAGIKTTAAFVHFQNRIPAKDADAVLRLKEAGAIIIGKTNMHELAMGTTSTISHYGCVHNPWNRAHIAGGSSGGSAAAVASGLCYATIDTDAIGSCRLPAACCGIIGFKATYGLIDMQGILDGEPVDKNILHLTHSAFLCRNVNDAKILLEVLSDQKNRQTGKSFNGKIGIARNFKATDEIRVAFSNAVDTFHSLGYTSMEIEAPLSVSFDTKNIEEDRKSISKTLFQDLDLLMLPTTTETAPNIQEADVRGPLALSPNNTFFCNYYGLPAISIPCGFGKNGLPIGFQIVGEHGSEDIIFELSNLFEKATQWHRKHPLLA